MAITSSAKNIMLDELNAETLVITINDDGDLAVDAVANTGYFSSSSSGMTLTADIVFDVPAGTIVETVSICTSTPTSGVLNGELARGTLSGTVSERTFTYAGTYTLTAFSITLS